MKHFARIENDKVAEIYTGEVLPPFHPSLIWMECGEEVEEEWVLSGEDLCAPAPATPVVPQEITAWQGLTTLNRSGLYDDVKAFVDAMPDDEIGTQAKIDFYRASVWKRNWAWLNNVAKDHFSLTDAQIDAMFIAASAL